MQHHAQSDITPIDMQYMHVVVANHFRASIAPDGGRMFAPAGVEYIGACVLVLILDPVR